ncbi:helix-turn-helix domain-containing protein [Rhodococcus aetherivorans]|uniref:Helix-turn-helix domain-containing protein n=1 Tax=Rhodococcus aetherivorans TaxID=191292 RepID=A0AA46P3W0_9NOCA|nr:helix-turn-helix domain-containing protein [Rhodococcus aetherivorans]UGQ40658.1 helix-turn-helix domain-containing protein [Rhodococcus aetherivorans]UYF93735.1 helix-turn-helix domain-containing protein [Rhodococcus aetherivorans]
MTTVGDIADLAGLRALTPDAVARMRNVPVKTLRQIDPSAPISCGESSIAYLPSAVWASLSSPESTAGALRAEGAVAVIVDNDDWDLPPEFLTECVRQSIPVFVLPSSLPFSRLGTVLDPNASSVAKPADTDADTLRDALDAFVAGGDVRAWLVMQGCVLTRAPTVDMEFLARATARPPVPLDRISASAAVIHTVLPSSGHTMVLANPSRTGWDVRLVRRLAERLDACVHAVEVARSARRQSENALVRELITATVAAEALDPWAHSLGLEPGSRIRAVAIVAAEPAGFRAEPAVAALQDLGLRADGTCVAGAHDDGAYALITMDGGTGPGGVDDGPAFDHHLEVLKALFTRRHGAAAAVGTSSCVLRGSDDLVRALISARQLAERDARAARTGGHSVPLPAPLAATLLAAEPRLAAVLDRALLKPVVDYDDQKGSRYLETLRTFLALDAHWGATAAELGIHINTLRYRLARIERLTGRGLHTTADRTDFYLALVLRESGGGD